MSDNLIKIEEENTSRITIKDVAEALGISKTTVSRAISGKGRIGEETRKRVLDYIEENGYQPNPIAKGLAQQRTYNIGWVMPGDSTITDLPFFQRCMTGVIETASASDYDVLISMVYDYSISGLERMVNGHKVDGVILGRTLINDANVAYLKESKMPFVVIGSTNEKQVIQVDNDHIKACKELTSILLHKGIRKLILVGGSDNHMVNQTRRKGFEEALAEYNEKKHDNPTATSAVYMNSDNDNAINRIVDEALRDGTECIVCMDDKVCNIVLEKLHKDNVSIPNTIKVASFYNSDLISNAQPPITTLQYDPKELGAEACRILFSYIAGEQVQEKTFLSYEVLLKGSTQ